MVAVCFGSVGLGLIIGLLFSLMYSNADSGWKKLLSSLIAPGASGGGIMWIYNSCGINDYKIIFISMGTTFITLILVFIIFMFIMCKILKDKDDNNILRIRDIILGQKTYIQEYFVARKNEIDDKLNIKVLRQREENISIKEAHIESQRELLEQEREEINQLTKGKLKIKLPENKNLTVTKEFLDLFPAYVEDLAAFIEAIKEETELFIQEHKTVNYEDLKVFLMLLSIHISEHLFGKGVRDVRVHFRYYDEKRNGYEKLISTIGDRENRKNMTFIPFDKANMIVRSFQCKRALIKSHNLSYDFVGNNNTTWTEYITGAFYNITKDNKPCLSFGISVKNSAKFKNLFNFLNYCKFESYLQDVVEQFDETYGIETILYGKHTI